MGEHAKALEIALKASEEIQKEIHNLSFDPTDTEPSEEFIQKAKLKAISYYN